MKNKLILPILSITLLSCCLFGCNKNNNNKGDNDVEPVVLPDAFKNTNFCNIGIVYSGSTGGGAALIFDNNLNPTIQNVSFHYDFYDIQFEKLPLQKDGDMYYMPFKVLDKACDDGGYFENNVEYKFWLSYVNETYYCAISLNDPAVTVPDGELVEGYLDLK